MILSLSIFLIVISVIGALLEVQIEGKDGWAGKLPTWRAKNKVISYIFGEYELTGYALYMNLFVMLLLHFPFILGVRWSSSFELKVLAFYLFFWLLEDFFWFVFNPHFGIKKFNKESIPWHRSWILGLPKSYYVFFVGGMISFALSYL